MSLESRLSALEAAHSAYNESFKRSLEKIEGHVESIPVLKTEFDSMQETVADMRQKQDAMAAQMSTMQLEVRSLQWGVKAVKWFIGLLGTGALGTAISKFVGLPNGQG